MSSDPYPPPGEPPRSRSTVPPPPPPDLLASADRRVLDQRAVSVGHRTQHAPNQPAIGAGPAAATWLLAWIAANVLASVIIVAAVGVDDASNTASMSSGLIIGSLVVQWAAFVGGAVLASRRFGSGNFAADLGLAFKPIDLLGLPMGALTQLVLVPLAYLPLRYAWPDTFSPDALEQRSRDIFDNRSTVGVAFLTILVVVGAPLVEEIVYRGMLQRSFARPLGRVGAWLAISIWFAIVHMSPVEIPGLFLAGAVFGLGVLLTNRIGFGFAAHMGFNGTAMVLMLLTS